MSDAINDLRGITTLDAVLPHLQRRPPIEVEPLAERLWSASAAGSRALFAEGAESVVVFDTLGTPGAAAALRDAIAAAVPGKPISTIIYTHDHLDASGWAAVLAPDAELIAHESTAALIELRGADGQPTPQRRIEGAGAELDLDGVAVDLRYPGPTHGTGNLAVLFPDSGTMFMSGTALPNARYGFFPDVHVGSYARSMRSLLGATEFVTFVPGRYETMDRAGVVAAVDYFEALDETCQRAYVDPEIFIWVMDMVGGYAADRLRGRFGHLDGFDQHLPLGAYRIVHHYLMGGWGREDTPAGDWTLHGERAGESL
jgi:glyoxylase-like metal-dependent hydrolase (beta-lactamase superfamily II)